MSLFKRKIKVVGKGADESVRLHKEFEVLNCTPVDYTYTAQYVEFFLNAKMQFKKIIHKTSVDDLCDGMLDAYIDSKIKQIKDSAREQYTYHMYVIAHHKGLLDGELVCATGHLENLKQDLAEIEGKIAAYKEMKQERNIF